MSSTSRASPTSPANLSAREHGLALQPSPALLDVDGAALVLFVNDVVAGANARVQVSRAAAFLVVTTADVADARALLALAVDKPMAPAVVSSLHARAVGAIALARSHLGTWAQGLENHAHLPWWVPVGTLIPLTIAAVLIARTPRPIPPTV